MYIIAYEYESARGAKIRKAVVCDTKEEYERIQNTIQNVGYKMLVFNSVLNSKYIH